MTWRASLALIRVQLRLALRERPVLFFNYVFPLIFFFGFGAFLGGRAMGAAMTRVVSLVVVLGILGSGLFGAGLRAVAERENGILRRYKVAPITPIPILVASLVTGWVLYLPSAVMIILLSHIFYKMPLPSQPLSLFVFITLGCFAFRAIGGIIAAVANSTAESNILVQFLYMPMLFLSGATFPISSMPVTAQIISQFLPASYLNTGIQHVMIRSEGLAANLDSVLALIVCTIAATFISAKLFRWEKEEKLPGSSKAWVLAVLLPFILLGTWQAYSREHINEAKQLDRQIRRSQARLIRGALIFVGDGKVIPNGAVLIRNGKIEEVFSTPPPDADKLNAEIMEAAGKTLLPGLIDVHVHLGAPGGPIKEPESYDGRANMERALAAYLYSGVTAVRSLGDFTSTALNVRETVNSGTRLGAELFVAGPLFTAEGGHGTEYFKDSPEPLRKSAEEEFLRKPKTAAEAVEMVKALKALRVDAIKAVLEPGFPGHLFTRMDRNIFLAVAEQAHASTLPLAVHTGTAGDVRDALDGQADSIEHGSFSEILPEDLLARMAKQQSAYDPTYSIIATIQSTSEKRFDFLGNSLVQQVTPPDLIERTRKQLIESKPFADAAQAARWEGTAKANLVAAWKAGVPLVTGTDSGNTGLFHGPAIHQELKLWTAAGVPVSEALKAATYGAAKVLRAENHIGLIRKGYDATLLLVDGNPLTDIAATERISSVFLKGENVSRSDLFDQK